MLKRLASGDDWRRLGWLERGLHDARLRGDSCSTKQITVEINTVKSQVNFGRD
jgi:hypothetical protein